MRSLPGTAPVFLLIVDRSRRAHIIGVVVKETSSETPMATRQGDGNSRKRRPTMPAHHQDRDENRHQRQADRNQRKKPISLAPSNAASSAPFPLQVAGNIFDNDDGVVDDESGADVRP